MPRYALHNVSPALNLPAIRDSSTGKVVAYGARFYFEDFRGSHRAGYTDKDAAYVVQWLNERDPPDTKSLVVPVAVPERQWFYIIGGGPLDNSIMHQMHGGPEVIYEKTTYPSPLRHDGVVTFTRHRYKRLYRDGHAIFTYQYAGVLIP